MTHLRYSWRGGKPGESRMAYCDSFSVPCQIPFPPATVLLTGVDVLLEVRPLNVLFDWFRGHSWSHARTGADQRYRGVCQVEPHI